jgi:hypothetical protein
MQGFPPNEAPQRRKKTACRWRLTKLRGVYSDNLIEVVEWCMALDPLSRPQSVFALQKELSREGERRYTKLSVAEKMRLQLDTLVSDTKKNVQKVGEPASEPSPNDRSTPSGSAGPYSLTMPGIPAAQMKFSVFQISRRGGREKNEDRMGYCYTRESGLFVLADGMGGHPEGEVAAQIALQTVSAMFQRQAKPRCQMCRNSCRPRCWRRTTRSCATPATRA